MSKSMSEAFRSSARKWASRANLALGALVAACVIPPPGPLLGGESP